MKTFQNGTIRPVIAMAVLRSGILVMTLWVGFLPIMVFWMFGIVQPLGTLQFIFGL